MHRSLIKFLMVFIFSQMTLMTHFSLECDSDEFCKQKFTDDYFCIQKLCKHKDIELNNTKDIISLFLILITSGLTNIGGIGGGEILVPLFFFIFNFTIDNAIPLSKLTIFSGALTNIFLIFNKRQDEDKNKFMINYHLVFFQLPLIFGGTLLGIQLMKLIPSFYIFIFLIVYLSFSTFKMFRKAFVLSKKENEDKQQQQNNTSQTDKQLTGEQQDGVQQDSLNINNLQVEIDNEAGKEKLIESNQKQLGFFQLFKVHFKNLSLCLIIFMLVIGLDIVSKQIFYKKSIDQYKGNIIIWLSVAFILTICCLISYYILQIQKRKLEESQNQDDKENYVLMKDFIFASLETGVLSGMLGIGGGIIINPKLISYGLDPEICAAVSATIVLFTSMSTTIQFFILEAFDTQNMIYIFIFSSIGCIIGNLILNYVMIKYKKKSIIVWILDLLLLLSLISLGIMAIQQINDSGLNAFSE